MDDELENLPGFTEAPAEEESRRLSELGKKLYVLDADIVELEHKLDEKKKARLEVAMHELPDYMKLIGQDKVGLPDFNVDLVMEPYYHANIAADWPDDKRQAAFSYLEEIDAGDLIKTQVVFLFGRKELKRVKWLLAFISTLKHYLKEVGGEPEDIPEPLITMGVPWNTLTAFVKEQITGGKKLDLDKIGATVGSVVKIKPRKK